MPDIAGGFVQQDGGAGGVTQDQFRAKGEGEMILEDLAASIREMVAQIDAETESNEQDNQPEDQMKNAGKMHVWLESQMARNAEAMGASARIIGTVSGPNLPLPELIDELRGVSTLTTERKGNPWLEKSLAVDMFSAMWDLIPILAQIKITETEIENELMAMQWEFTKKIAEAMEKKADLQAKDLELQAYKSFIQAGIAVGMMVFQLTVQTMQKVYNQMKSGVNTIKANLNTVKSVVGSGVKAVGAGMSAAKAAGLGGKLKDGLGKVGGKIVGTKIGGAITKAAGGAVFKYGSKMQDMRDSLKSSVMNKLPGGAAGALKTLGTAGSLGRDAAVNSFKQSVSDGFKTKMDNWSKGQGQLKAAQSQGANTIASQMRFNMLEGMFSNVASGVIDQMRAENQRQIGIVEYNITMMQQIKENLGRARDSAREAKREAAELIAAVFQMATKFIELQSQAFRLTR